VPARPLLQQAIDGFVAGGIHHVGSTSVPGLDAKPIIDILAGVRDLEGARPCIGLVAPLGYLYGPYRADEMLWFCKQFRSDRDAYTESKTAFVQDILHRAATTG
jgi:GrpB-like predicted nucleotidyltransferase (UPF0157 family)